MSETELWLTAFFNAHFAGVANWILSLAKMKAENPAQPWANWAVMELVVFIILVVTVAVLRSTLSMDKPGKLQHIFEVIYNFLNDQADEAGVHHKMRFLPFFGTLFLFVLFANLLGVIPGFEAPTMSPMVPLGCAVVTFVYYNVMGLKENGLFRYVKHFTGSSPGLAVLMFPIEIVSHLARMLSLTVRLFANMFAGEKVTMAFLSLSYLVFPALFMGLHVFVSLLQAYVFALLAMIYVSSATAHEH